MFKRANALVRAGLFEEAESIYEKLYLDSQLEIYKTSLDYVRKKLNKHNVINNLDSSINKILFVTAGLKGPTAGGGIATTFHSMIKTVSEDVNNNISILYVAHPYYASGNYEQWKQYYKGECRADLLSVDINKKNYGSQEMQRSHAVLEYLIETEGQFDTVVFHDYNGLAYYTLLAKKYNFHLNNMRIVISAHGNHTLSYYFGAKKINTWHEKVAIFMERASLVNAHEVTTPSEYYSKWFEQNFGNKNACKFPNIILENVDAKSKINLTYKNTKNQLVVFYGRIERLKGIDIFLETIMKNQNDGKIYNILFAGNNTKIDGVDAKEYIEAKLNAYNGEFKFQYNCEAVALYNYVKENNGVCVFPTLGETSSCVVVESIQAGIRFIASDIPGIKELIADEYQDKYLFKAGSSESLATMLNQLPPIPNHDVLSFDMNNNKEIWKNFFSKKENSLSKQTAEKITNELITVIIPTCDRPQLLKDSLLSIKNQTYRNIEIIVVDDASIVYRENEAIVKSFGAKYIHSVEKIYKGAACNLAVQHAKGKYICFFDDDDIAKPEMIKNYMYGFSSDESVDVFSGFADVFEHAVLEKTGEIDVEYTSLALGGGLEVNLHINFFGKGTFIIKRDRFNDVGGYEIDNDPVPMVDYRFYIKSALHGLNIATIPTGQYYYRKNSPNSLFYQNKDKRHLQYLAKKSMQNILEKKLGSDIGKGFASMIWEISLPKFD